MRFNGELSYVGGFLTGAGESRSIFHKDAGKDKWTKLDMELNLDHSTTMPAVCVM